MDSERAGLEDKEAIAYIRQMLGELHQVARNEGADMLCYLIETALTEAREDYYRRLPADHPDRKSPAL